MNERSGRVQLLGRDVELAALKGVVDRARAGSSGVLVVHGEAGMGKSALLHAVREHATGCDVAHVGGARAEADLPYAILDQLCRPLADRVDRLPMPHRAALDAAFGLVEATAAGRLLLGQAVLTLLGRASSGRPLVCLIDDADWIDDASAAILAFVARRLADEPVALVLAARTPRSDLAGLPELPLARLADDDARALLDRGVRRPLDPRVRDRILAEARGNPAVLLSAAHGLAASPFVGGSAELDVAAPPGGGSPAAGALDGLAEDTRMILVIAAAEPTGDPLLLWTAAEMLGIEAAALDEARATGHISVGALVRFGHPQLRDAVYRSAMPEERRLAHGALAAATDAGTAPERRAWHEAQEASTPDERIAAGLERWAGRAAEHAGIAAASAFLREAVTLTPGAAARGRRALAAAEATMTAGDTAGAGRVLATAEAAPMDAAGRARTELTRARLAAATAGAGAAASLLQAARRLSALDPDGAREAYLDALAATVVLGDDAGAEPTVIAREALTLRGATAPRAQDLLLEGLALQVVEGPAAAAATLRDGLAAFAAEDLPAGAASRWGWLAAYAAATIWAHGAHRAVAERIADDARARGALDTLPLTLAELVGIRLREGDVGAAATLAAEADAAARMTEREPPVHLRMLLAAYRGREAEVEASAGEAGRALRLRGLGATLARGAAALLYNGLGRYDDALRAAGKALEGPDPAMTPGWVLPELVEAAVRAGSAGDAGPALRRLTARARLSGTDWALGLEARCRALLAHGEEAERLHVEAIARLSRPESRVDAARAHLLYGEWLRREGRRVDARKELRLARAEFADMGIEAFAQRARRELRATGETARRRTDETREDLTAQELQVAQLARSGLSNQEIGARLYLSPRTVEWHLRKVFAKLDVRSRHALAGALPEAEPELVPAA